jgi:superfamily I DNA and/or RNA helicase
MEKSFTPDQIGVVTPFKRQAEKIRSRLKSEWGDEADAISVGTAHTFQGDEREVIMFSPVAAKGISETTLRWMNNPGSDAKNLLNVALTRARQELHIVGDADFFRKAGHLLGDLVLYCENLGRLAPFLSSSTDSDDAENRTSEKEPQ